MSPELVLVDPELARIARARLRRPDDCLDRPTRAQATSCAAVESNGLDAPDGAERPEAIRSRGARRGLATAARGIVVLLVLAVPFLAFLPADDSLQPKLAPADPRGRPTPARHAEPHQPSARVVPEDSLEVG